MRKRWLVLIPAAAGMLAVAFIILSGRSGEKADLHVLPQIGPFQVTVTSTGELQAKNSVSIYGPSNARKARIYQMNLLKIVPEGTIVQKGDFVAELDRSELTSQIKDAEVELQKATSQFTQTRLDTSLTLSKNRDDQVNLRYAMEEAELRKEESKYEPPSVRRQAEIDFEKAQRAYDQAVKNYQTQIEQAVAKMQEVEAELSKTQRRLDELMELSDEFTISAPENGMVIYRRDWRGQKLKEGGQINAWDPVVATLPDLSVMESKTYINEVDIQKIQEGQQVILGLDADPDKRLTGNVSTVANIGEQRPNSDAKVFEVTIVVAESDSTLRPAMTTSNTIIVDELPEALYIPLECLRTRDSLNYVYVERSGGLARQEVRLGPMNEDEVVVEEGLAADDLVLMSAPQDGEKAPIEYLEENLTSDLADSTAIK